VQREEEAAMALCRETAAVVNLEAHPLQELLVDVVFERTK
jgi:hypothetical protein